MKIKLDEILRKDIIKSSKIQSPDRLLRSKKYSTRDFKTVDFKELFENDTFTWSAKIGDHMVTISFEGPFEELKWYVKSMRGPNRTKRLTQSLVASALTKALDTNDLYVNCECEDFTYRFAYFATRDDFKYGAPESRPPKYQQTNKDNSKGKVCKHILCVLIGKRWVPFAAKAWLQYMKSNVELTEFYLWNKPIKPESDQDIETEKSDNLYSKEKDSSGDKSEETNDTK